MSIARGHALRSTGVFIFVVALIVFPKFITAALAAAEKSQSEMIEQCKRNNLDECFNLSLSVTQRAARSGSRLSAADIELVNWGYGKDCDRDGAASCYNLGTLYDGDTYTKHNPQKAIAYYEKSCRLGFKLACTNLGAEKQWVIDHPVKPEKLQSAPAGTAYQRTCQMKLLSMGPNGPIMGPVCN